MKKVLIRSGTLPVDDVPFSTMIRRNILGSNIGNLLYTYSICRNLMQGEDTEFVSTKYKWNYSEKEIDEINSDYECFIIPLADAIRPQFLRELKGLTQLVRSLTIPCYIIGIGVRAPYDPEPDFHYDFDDDVKEFINAVLDKSAMVGLRGSITGEYLSRLGYKPEKDYTVIGCPSMYTFGNSISVRDEKITTDSTACYNLSPGQKNDVIEFIRTSADRFSKSYYIPQDEADLKIMWGGLPRANCADLFPKRIDDDIFVRDNARFFPNVLSWIHFLEHAQFSFGTRFHGNVAAVLAGTPALFFPYDARERELVEYHNFAIGGTPDDILNKNVDIFELIAKSDFHSAQWVHARNFDHYLEFLKINNIPHTYGAGNECELSAREQSASIKEPLKPVTAVDAKEIAFQINDSNEMLQDKHSKQINNLKKQNTTLQQKVNLHENEIADLKKDIENLEKELKDKKAIIASQEKELNFRSVKLVRKIRSKMTKKA